MFVLRAGNFLVCSQCGLLGGPYHDILGSILGSPYPWKLTYSEDSVVLRCRVAARSLVYRFSILEAWGSSSFPQQGDPNISPQIIHCLLKGPLERYPKVRETPIFQALQSPFF